jgi:hypothetical protein
MALDLSKIPATCGIHATLAECERMGDMVANIVTAVATAAYPDDPEQAAAFALASIDRIYGLPAAQAEPAGPDYPRELETADEAAAELMEQETT